MRNKLLDKFAINFIENHFDEIDLKKCEWNVKTKEQAIKQIKKVDVLTGWIITEVMNWGTSINYIEKYKVKNDEELFIINVEDRYFTLDYDTIHFFKEVFPKKVMVEKLIFNV